MYSASKRSPFAAFRNAAACDVSRGSISSCLTFGLFAWAADDHQYTHPQLDVRRIHDLQHLRVRPKRPGRAAVRRASATRWSASRQESCPTAAATVNESTPVSATTVLGS